MASPPPERPIEEPLSELERQFITEYLANAGADYHALVVRNDDQARALLRQAAQSRERALERDRSALRLRAQAARNA